MNNPITTIPAYSAFNFPPMPIIRKLTPIPAKAILAMRRTPTPAMSGPTSNSAGMRPILAIPIKVPYCSALIEKYARIRVAKTGKTASYADNANKPSSRQASIRRCDDASFAVPADASGASVISLTNPYFDSIDNNYRPQAVAAARDWRANSSAVSPCRPLITSKVQAPA